MLFNSWQFLLFFPVVTVIYFLIPHRYRWFHLLISSCIFYTAFIPVYILILFFTIIIDYIAGILIEDAEGRRRKIFLSLSIVTNILVLAVFKYYNFLIDNVNTLINNLGVATYDLPLLNIILPIGLSFHTFQAMSYTIEVYRGNQKAERHLGIFALYVMFYPQLVAGPIERPQNLLHQFHDKHFFNSQNLIDGLRLMTWGFFKKIVIADRLALYVNEVYAEPENFHYLNLIIATLFFAIQIYCDFSGYSDIAIGAARTMGFKLMTNFNRPYFATNIQTFWKRWHISLSTWFRDYLYIPLGGNRVGVRRLYFNVAVVFLLSGLWHGANFTFLAWGALHAVFILIYMLYASTIKGNRKNTPVKNFFGAAFTFILVSLAWIFFRAENMTDALLVVKNIVSLNNVNDFTYVLNKSSKIGSFGIGNILLSIFLIGLMFLVESLADVNFYIFNNKPLGDVVFTSVLVVIIMLAGEFYNNSFIYFQF